MSWSASEADRRWEQVVAVDLETLAVMTAVETDKPEAID